MPAAIGQIFIGFIADVVPFVDFIRGESESCPKYHSLASFHPQGYSYFAENLSNTLGRLTQRLLKVRLTIQPWRHIAIAIGRDLIRAYDEDTEENEKYKPSRICRLLILYRSDNVIMR